MFLRRLVRRVALTPPGQVLGKAAYEGLAQVAARTLVAIPGVVSVYANGSLRSEWLSPGYSDIDLALVVRLDGLSEELRFRAALRRRLRLLNRLAPVFRDQNYLEIEDLPLLRRFTDAWAVNLDARWTWLAGEKIPVLPEGAPAQGPRARWPMRST